MKIDHERFPCLVNGDYISELQVMRSAAGWYLGRSYWDPEYEFEGPYCRCSEYFPSESTAQTLLEEYRAEGETLDIYTQIPYVG